MTLTTPDIEEQATNDHRFPKNRSAVINRSLLEIACSTLVSGANESECGCGKSDAKEKYVRKCVNPVTGMDATLPATRVVALNSSGMPEGMVDE